MNNFFLLLAFAVLAVVYCSPMGRGHKGMGFMMGPLRNLTTDQRAEFMSIVRDQDQTQAQMDQRLQQFASTLPAQSQQAINDMINNRRSMQMTAPEGLSAAAQSLFDQKQQIMNNQSLTIAQQRDQMAELMMNADPEARDELKQAFHQQKMQQMQQNMINTAN